jgi:hypothetical protein
MGCLTAYCHPVNFRYTGLDKFILNYMSIRDLLYLVNIKYRKMIIVCIILDTVIFIYICSYKQQE